MPEAIKAATCELQGSRSKHVLLLGLMVLAVAITGACRSAVAPASTEIPVDEPTAVATAVAAPMPNPTELAEPGLPAVRPVDFVASYSQDGGMAPWHERIEVRNDGAMYLLWIEGLELRFDHTPAPARIDALYEELRLGRFELYEIIPFGEDEVIYDHEQTSWSVRAGDYDHRLRTGGEEIVRPQTDRSPLRSLSGFADDDWAVPGSSSRATVRIGDADLWGTVVAFDLGDADFAMGEDRWNTEMQFAWTGGPIDVTATVVEGNDPDNAVTTTFDITLADGAVVEIGRDSSGQVYVD